MCSLTGHWPLIVSRQSLTIEVYPFFGQHIPDGGVGRARRCVLRYFHFSVYGVVIVADVLVGFLPLERGYGTELTEFPAFFLQIFAQLAAQPGDGLFHQRLSVARLHEVLQPDDSSRVRVSGEAGISIEVRDEKLVYQDDQPL